jgi:RimJ/RimL family protein N-acetyltransferase
VEYKPSYAKCVADMWKKSSKGWGGECSNETEETVLRANENNANINTYLALLGEDVVGYCGLSQYIGDENSLYIPLLNVRYDLHGKSIGRTLVCKAVERTTELEWPRLDLYTWPGNTKSLPLYKRCGFFYEKREDYTHLMNFIPGVLNSEAFKDFFENVHWYKNMKRTIDLEPDGLEENGFTFYEYLWEKDGQTLRIQFDNKSRGIHLIETDDYLITTNLQHQKLIFGQNYNIKYEIVNKSGKPLNISIEGKNNKNIEYSFNKTTSVTEKEILEGEFLVKLPLEKTGLFSTYPSVVSEIYINGKKVEFKIGVDTQYPANISLSPYKNEYYKKITSTMYLDIENNYKENTIFKFELPENKDITFSNKNIALKMKPNEKKSIKLQFTLNNFTFYNELIKVTAQLNNGKEIIFEKQICAALIGRNGMFGGQGEDYYIIVNGPYSVIDPRK